MYNLNSRILNKVGSVIKVKQILPTHHCIVCSSSNIPLSTAMGFPYMTSQHKMASNTHAH